MRTPLGSRLVRLGLFGLFLGLVAGVHGPLGGHSLGFASAALAAQDPVSALIGEEGGGEAAGGSADEAPAEPLDSTLDPAEDARLEASLEERFDRIDGLEDVQVEVDAGVVQLEGEVVDGSAADTAESLARRTEGVAEVENQIQQTRSVTSRLNASFQRVKDRFFDLLSYLPLLFVALLVLLLAVWLGRWASRREALYDRLTHSEFIRNLLQQLVYLVIVIGGILIALDLLDATTLVGAVLGTAGVVGLAIGFAFKDLVENYIASVLLSLRQPFEPNDLVEIDGRCGKIVRLTSRATILMTMDGNHLRIPNAQVFKAVILNFTRNPLRRFDFGVGFGVDEDLVQAQTLGLDVLREMEGVLADPEPWARVQELGDSNVLVRYYAWVDQQTHSFAKVESAAIRRVKVALDDAGIDMPEPIYRLKLLGSSGEALSGFVTTEEVETPAVGQATAAGSPVVEQPRPSADDPHEDLSADDSLDRQIAADRARSDEPDLLSEEAPQEL